MLRLKPGVSSLRTRTMYGTIRRVLAHFLGRADFRFVHVSLQGNHLHLLVEAQHASALRKGMQSFAIRAARAINRAMGRVGKVFAYRYHATYIVSPRQARNTLAYVLNNWRKHREHCANARTLAAAIDPYASGLAFTGWRAARFATPAGYVPLPTSPPSTRLLTTDWRQHGLIDPYETPGPVDPRFARRGAL